MTMNRDNEEVDLPELQLPTESIWDAVDRHRKLLRASLLRERELQVEYGRYVTEYDSRSICNQRERDAALVRAEAAESRVAVLEGLLREFVAAVRDGTACTAHSMLLMLGIAKRSDSALTPASPLTEPQKERH